MFLSNTLSPFMGLTSLGGPLIPLLDEQVPGALREEGQEQQLYQGRDACQAQHQRPAWGKRYPHMQIYTSKVGLYSPAQ